MIKSYYRHSRRKVTIGAVFALLFKNFIKRKLLLFSLIILLITIPIFTLILRNKSTVEAAWMDEAWLFRKAISIPSHTTLETNVYVSVPTFDATDTTKFQADCGDLRFTKQNGELLPYFVVDCDATADIHVKFDSLPAGATTYYMYYGNSTAANGFTAVDFTTAASGLGVQALATEEKSAGPVAYWKFDEGQGDTAFDSTINANNGTTTGSTWQTEDQCISGKCIYVNQSSTISIGNSSSLNITDAISVSVWVKPTTITGVIPILSRAIYQSPYSGYSLEIHSGKPTILINGGRENGAIQRCNEIIEINKFSHLIWVRNSSNASKIYINGRECTYSSSINISQTSVATTIGIGSKLSKNNIAPYTNYANRTYNRMYDIGGWGGDDAEVYYYANSGYDNLPYKKMIKTAGGTGGSYVNDYEGFSIEDSKKYIVSSWMKASRTESNVLSYALDLNRGSDNAYRLGSNINLTTSWQNIYWTYNAGVGHSGSYRSRGIVYIDNNLPVEIYWSGFQVEEVTGTDQTTPTQRFTGILDEIKIYPYARTAAQIKADFASKGAGSVKGTSAALGTNAKNSDALSNGLVGYWKMDEASWNGSANEVIDYSGNNNHGVGVGSTKPSTGTGKFGNGGVFDGVSQYINGGTNSSLNLVPRTNAMTFSLWVSVPAEVSTIGYLLSKKDTGVATTTQYGIYYTVDGILTFNLGSSSTTVNSGDLRGAGWKHIVLTVPASITGAKFYINGTEQAFSSGTGDIGTATASYSTLIGARHDSSESSSALYYTGSIDEVRVYNRALSGAEVSTLYNYAPGPIRYYKLDDASGTTPVDSSGNSATGSINGNPLWAPGKFGKGLKLDGVGDSLQISSF